MNSMDQSKDDHQHNIFLLIFMYIIIYYLYIP